MLAGPAAIFGWRVTYIFADRAWLVPNWPPMPTIERKESTSGSCRISVFQLRDSLIGGGSGVLGGMSMATVNIPWSASVMNSEAMAPGSHQGRCPPRRRGSPPAAPASARRARAPAGADIQRRAGRSRASQRFQMKARGERSSSSAVSHRDASIGVSVKETSREKMVAMTMLPPNSLKNWPTMP